MKYNLGIISCYIFTGETPFNTDAEIVESNLNFVEIMNWSWALKHFIKQCLKKNPFERPSVHQLISHPWFDVSEEILEE